MAFLSAEKIPSACFNSQAAVKLVHFLLTHVLFIRRVSQAFHALFVCGAIRYMVICRATICT